MEASSCAPRCRACAGAIAEALCLDGDRSRALYEDVQAIAALAEGRGIDAEQALDCLMAFHRSLLSCKGDGYRPRISRLALADGLELIAIEPPCGSSVYALCAPKELLLIDGGYPCHAPQLTALLARMIPDFDLLPKRMALTHPDEDHCGLTDLCDTIYVSPTARDSFALDQLHRPNPRQLVPGNGPYVRLSRLLCGYRPPRMEALTVVGEERDDPDQPLRRIGGIEFAGRTLDIHLGNGGHAPGEIIIVSQRDHLVFTGDVIVNPQGFTPAQAAFNRLAPVLMRSVNTSLARLSAQRRRILECFPQSDYRYCPGHGAIMGGPA